MDLNRRKFFGVAAASPLAAREAAAQVIEQAQMQASGMSLYSDSLYTGVSVSDFDDDSTPTRSLWEAIRDLGMPEWKKEDLWADAKRSRTIDPDIAAMRSLSMNAKLDMQWKRNYDDLVASAFKQQKMERLKRQFFNDNSDVLEY
ncbi:MAG TPA: hypothetical protein VMX97_17915 [Hyphomicrobiaceae bacterium]|nr:hypothetical protein [Hyphomicrobiaceae bacterium]